MVSKTLDQVLLAERQAAEKVDLANQKSSQMIADSKEQAKDRMDQAKQDSKKETEALIQKNKIRIDEILEHYNEAAMQEASKLRAQAQAKKGTAMDMVMKKILSI